MEGSTDSQYSSIILAGPPNTPGLSPTLITESTDDTQITVTMPLIPESGNGNSAIISYQLDIDDGIGGDYSPVGGYDPLSLITTYSITSGIVRGRTYRLRYRSLNGAGWSGYSPLLYATAATTPSAPSAPTLDSATGTSITLNFYESSDNGGSKITLYELWIDEGTLGSDFNQVTTYTNNAMSTTLTGSVNLITTITAGTVYTFKIRAKNAVDYSPFSAEVRFAAATPPAKPATPTKILSTSSKTSITVKWSQSANTEIPIQGYKLYMSNGTGVYSLIYDGELNPLQRSYTVTGLTTGN